MRAGSGGRSRRAIDSCGWLAWGRGRHGNPGSEGAGHDDIGRAQPAADLWHDGMLVECECGITMDHGFVLQADVPRQPAAAAEHQALGHPVTLSTAAPGQPDREVP